jgi:putative spermidine/putrescine transport system permease protein
MGLAWTGFILAFIYAPILVVVGASFDRGATVGYSAFLQFPPRSLSLHWYAHIQPEILESLGFSVKLALAVAAGALVIGAPTALSLSRLAPRAAAMLEALMRMPQQIPFVVTSVAFLQAYYLLARLLGWPLPGSVFGLYLAHLFVATPYTIGSVVVSLRRLSPSFEQAAMGLGAPYWRVLLRVTLPLIAPGLYAGVLYAFLISFTDVTLAVFLSGSGFTPFPVWVVNALATGFDPSIAAVATLIFVGSLGGVYILQRLLGLETLARGAGRGG